MSQRSRHLYRRVTFSDGLLRLLCVKVAGLCHVQADSEESPGGQTGQHWEVSLSVTVSPETPEALQGVGDHSRRSARASARKPRAMRAPMSASPTIPGPGPSLASPGSGARSKRSSLQMQPSTAAPRNTRPRLTHGAALKYPTL